MAHVTDSQRRDGQCDKILKELQRAPCSNRELSTIALSYTKRIQELRQAGHDIQIERLGGGLNFYHLVSR